MPTDSCHASSSSTSSSGRRTGNVFNSSRERGIEGEVLDQSDGDFWFAVDGMELVTPACSPVGAIPLQQRDSSSSSHPNSSSTGAAAAAPLHAAVATAEQGPRGALLRYCKISDVRTLCATGLARYCCTSDG